MKAVLAIVGVMAVGLQTSSSQLPLARTSSSSGQFSVYGDSAPRRLAVARRAEEIREGWLATTGLPADWTWPIIIELSSQPQPGRSAPVTSLFVGDASTLKVQVTALPGTSAEELNLGILRALALEFAYRKARPQEGKPFNMPPSWLIESVWQTIQAREEGLPPGFYLKLVEAGPPPKLEAFLRQRPEFMKTTARAIYRAQALGLLGALGDTQEGKAGLRRYLESLYVSRPDDARALLAAFPSLEKNPAQLTKLWTLAMARASSPGRLEPLASSETFQRLQNLWSGIKAPTDMKLPEGTKAKGVELMPILAGHPSGRSVLARLAEQLQALELRAHPLWVPVVAEYKTLALELSRKPRKDAARRLLAAEELAQALHERMQAISDHVNWFEASQVEVPSGSFDPPPPLPAVAERNDPITTAISLFERSR